MNVKINQKDFFVWGLIGNQSIGKYSVAPKMWEKLFELKNIPVKYFILGDSNSSVINSKLKEYIKNPNFIGANIALPWKNLVYEFCTYVEDSANKVDTINTIIRKDKEIQGFNTDGKGIINSIKSITSLKNKKILMLGCGSSAQTVPFHLINGRINSIYFYDSIDARTRKMYRKYSFSSKKRKVNLISLKREEIDKIINKIDIIINTTPCGMKGHKEKMVLSNKELKKIKKTCVGIEAVYTPYETPFLKKMKQMGNKISPGVKMLVEQAAESFSLAFNKKITTKEKQIMGEVAIAQLSK